MKLVPKPKPVVLSDVNEKLFQRFEKMMCPKKYPEQFAAIERAREAARQVQEFEREGRKAA